MEPRNVAPDESIPSAESVPAWLDLEGTVNTRDLGGLPTRDGRVVREGRLLRSDGLIGLTPRDVDVLARAYGLQLVVDLRSSIEVELDGVGPLPGLGVRRLWAPFFRGEQIPEITRLMHANGLPYQVLTEMAAPALVELLGELAKPGGLPAVVHCAAGKDRTGITIALVLELLGVDRTAIVADYMATLERLPQILERTKRLPSLRNLPADPRSLALNPEVIEQVFTLVDAVGGAQEWLSRQGAAPDLHERLRAVLLHEAGFPTELGIRPLQDL